MPHRLSKLVRYRCQRLWLKQLGQVKHVTQTSYATEAAAHDALKAQQVDSSDCLQKAARTYQATY